MSAEQSPAAEAPSLDTQDTNDGTPSTGTALSKSAQKRQAKAERFAKLKLERRAREKEQKLAKRKEREERAATGEDVGPSDAKKRRVSREGEGPVRPFNARIVIDLGFDEKMTEKEVGSLCSQLAYTYASHRRTRTPFTGLLFTSLSGRSRQLLDKTNDASYRRWKSVEWWEEDISGLWKSPSPITAEGQEPQAVEDAEATPDAPPQQTPINPAPTNDETVAALTILEANTTEPAGSSTLATPSSRLKHRRASRNSQVPQPRSSCSRESVVYLTADAEDELTELKEGETYIIGGIVDRNRYKNLCENKAKELNIRSARLPIGKYLADMPTRKVLTVNQVFDILAYWVGTRDWEQAMQKVMPKRKFNANGKKAKRPQGQTNEDEDDDAEAEADEQEQELTELDRDI